jgi:hypothetical protein
MRWSLPLAEPIQVSPVLTLRTLADARAFILSPSDVDRRRPHWHQLAALLVTCAKTGDQLLLAIFTGRLKDAITLPSFPKPDMPNEKKPAPPSARRRSKARQRRARRLQ